LLLLNLNSSLLKKTTKNIIRSYFEYPLFTCDANHDDRRKDDADNEEIDNDRGGMTAHSKRKSEGQTAIPTIRNNRQEAVEPDNT
jgi:hypothetical protein